VVEVVHHINTIGPYTCPKIINPSAAEACYLESLSFSYRLTLVLIVSI
jgi:hypothetical protein